MKTVVTLSNLMRSSYNVINVTTDVRSIYFSKGIQTQSIKNQNCNQCKEEFSSSAKLVKHEADKHGLN